MKKLILILLLGGFALTSCQKDDLSAATDLEAVEGRAKAKGKKGKKDQARNNNNNASFTGVNAPCQPVEVAELYAGQFELVGNVSVVVDGENYVVSYNVDPGYCITETHLSVVGDPNDFPLSGGGPPPGRFEYKGSHDCVSMVEYVVPVAKGTYFAAHAVVNCVSEDLESITEKLPESAFFSTSSTAYPGTLGGYFDVNVSDGSLSGTWEAWCADVAKPLDPGQGPFEAHVFSTYEAFDYSAVPNRIGIIQDNLDLANWLLNYKDMFIGKESGVSDGSGGFLTYNFGDVQWAIWKLLNDAGCLGCAGLGNKADLEAKGMEIYNAVLGTAEAEGYVPDCGDRFLVILIPKVGQTQPVMISYPIECKEACSETAWARNNENRDCGNFPGGNWATYFQYGM